MSCCINPQCPNPVHPDGTVYCQSCGVRIPDLLYRRFRMIKLLGQGGFGRTYLAEDFDKLKEFCVVKQLVANVQGTWALNKTVKLFEQESRKLQQLGKHDQIPTLYAYFEEQNQLYLVQEYIEGENLLEVLKKQGVWSQAQVKQLLENLLPVLAFVHQHNVIHRDIKPENIIQRRSDGKLVLLDFGIAKDLSATVLKTQIGTRIGSDGYAPLEQMLGGEAYPASDLFGLGATCFHLLTAVPPYQLFLRKGYSWTKNWRNSLPGSISQELGKILDKLLQEEIENRYASVAEVLQDLQLQSIPKPQPKIVQTPKIDEQNPGIIATLTGHSNPVRSVAFSPDGRTLASGSDDNTIKLWNVQSQRQITTLTGHSNHVRSVAFSPDGQTLASGSVDKTIKLWEVQSQRQIATLTGHSDYVWSVAFSPDGRTLASGSHDQTIKLWDVQSQRQIATLTGHSNYVRSVAFSPDGQTLASGSVDKTIKLWEVQSQRQIATLTGHSDYVWSVAFSPDGRTLASGSGDNTIKLWEAR